MTSVTIRTESAEATITVPDNDLDLFDIVEGLIKPALMGVGYYPDQVACIFVVDEDEDLLPEEGEENEDPWTLGKGELHDWLLQAEAEEMGGNVMNGFEPYFPKGI